MTDISTVITDSEMATPVEVTPPDPQDDGERFQARLLRAKPDDKFFIPTLGDAYRKAPELNAVVEDLLKREAKEIKDLQWTIKNVRIVYAWKQKGGVSHGQPVLGRCVKLGGVSKFFGKAEFLIWLAADHLTELAPTYEQIRALLFHELCHIDKRISEDGEITHAIRGHDAELFLAELGLFGAWWDDLRAAAEAFKQVGLFDAEAAD